MKLKIDRYLKLRSNIKYLGYIYLHKNKISTLLVIKRPILQVKIIK